MTLAARLLLWQLRVLAAAALCVLLGLVLAGIVVPICHGLAAAP